MFQTERYRDVIFRGKIIKEVCSAVKRIEYLSVRSVSIMQSKKLFLARLALGYGHIKPVISLYMGFE